MLLFFFLVVFKKFLAILVPIENNKQRLPLVIPTGPPVTVASEAIETLGLVADKTSKVLSKWSTAAVYLQSFLLVVSLLRISAIKYYFILLILLSLNCIQLSNDGYIFIFLLLVSLSTIFASRLELV